MNIFNDITLYKNIVYIAESHLTIYGRSRYHKPYIMDFIPIYRETNFPKWASPNKYMQIQNTSNIIEAATVNVVEAKSNAYKIYNSGIFVDKYQKQ